VIAPGNGIILYPYLNNSSKRFSSVACSDKFISSELVISLKSFSFRNSLSSKCLNGIS